MAISFPIAPSVGQVFVLGDKSWQFDGVSWKVRTQVASATNLGSIRIGENLHIDAQSGITSAAIAGIDTTTFAGFTNIDATGTANIANLNVTNSRYGILDGGESVKGSTGLQKEIISIKSQLDITEHFTVSPNGADDIAFIRYENLFVDDNVDFIVDAGDFVVDR
tara:strand:- start:2140 stop:2634 length:495 start_codon:yes stop_codon:yes gene_type:complete